MVGVYGANYDLVKQIVLFLMIIQGLIIYPEINKSFEDGRLDEVNKLMSINLNLFISLFEESMALILIILKGITNLWFILTNIIFL